MTRNDIIRMAQDAGWEMPEVWDASDGFLQRIERFARAAYEAGAAAEREACARLCDDVEERAQADYGGYSEATAYLDGREFAAAACAAAIRARGQA